jgi:LmbE family N-acetylglucosaminyl deacetylase
VSEDQRPATTPAVQPSPLPSARQIAGAHASVDLPVPRRCLAIGAHPDDVELLCGATLAKWAANGCTINHLVLTDGSKGTWDPDVDTDALVEVRAVEQLEAARRLGSQGKVVMLDEIDGELQATLEVRDEVARWIRLLRPDVVLAHDPWRRYRLHPDHRNAGWISLDAVVAARDPHFLRDTRVVPHRPSAVLLFEADEPDHVEDVDGFVDTKVDAALAHRSQYVTTHGIPPGDDGTAADAFRARLHAQAARDGQAVGLAAGEPFKALTDL